MRTFALILLLGLLASLQARQSYGASLAWAKTARLRAELKRELRIR